MQPDVPSYGAVQGMALEDFSRVTDALQQARALGSIGDWEIEPLPDGTTRLKRGTWARITRVGSTNWDENLALVLFILGAVFSCALASPKHGDPRPMFLVPAGLFSVCGLVLLTWMFCASEQLRVGKNLF